MCLSFKNQSIVWDSKSMDWSLYDMNFRLERVNRSVPVRVLHKETIPSVFYVVSNFSTAFL